MSRFRLLINDFQIKFTRNYDWMFLILSPMLFGIILNINQSSIWSSYTFPHIFKHVSTPGYIGMFMIACSILLAVSKYIMKSKQLMSISLSLSSFIWTLCGLIFLFAIPTNAVWIYAFGMVGLGMKLGLEE